MRSVAIVIGAAVLAVAGGGAALAQTRALSADECRAMRVQVSGHSRLSDGVRRMLASSSPAAVATTPRADVIRARLAQIPAARHSLETQRATAMKSSDISRVLAVHTELDGLEREETGLETELAAELVHPTAPAEPERRASDVSRVRCDEMVAVLDSALQIRRKELGARPRQEAVVPLVRLQGPEADKIGRELNRQLASWPAASTHLGLLDQDGDGRVDGFVDMPAEGIFRMYRVQANGTVTVQSFPENARAVRANYSEATRRVEEQIVAHERTRLGELMRGHPAGPVQVIEESATFPAALRAYLTGNFSAGVRQGVATRTREFKNFRGESVRTRDVITPTSGGLDYRQLVMLPGQHGQETWEERTTRITVRSSSQVDVETVNSHETRTAVGELVGAPATAAPVRFRVSR